jgi:hypothetical protein
MRLTLLHTVQVQITDIQVLQAYTMLAQLVRLTRTEMTSEDTITSNITHLLVFYLST